MNEDYEPLDFVEYEDLPIFTMKPPRLETKQDAIDFLAGYSYDVSNYTYRFVDDHRPGHVFSGDPMHISVPLNGAISVQIDSPIIPLWQPNITAEEAIVIATGYMENHTGAPDEAVMEVRHDNVGNHAGDRCITTFFIHFHRTRDGYDFASSGADANHIIINVDA